MTMETKLPDPENRVEAEVNPEDPFVTLWSGQTPIQVPRSKVAELRSSLGLTTHSPLDIPALASEAAAYAGALPALLAKFHESLEDGVIDPDERGNLYALQSGLRELNRVVDELLTVALQTWPVKATGETVTMHRKVPSPVEGEPDLDDVIEVDPGEEQIAAYREQGYAVRRASARRAAHE